MKPHLRLLVPSTCLLLLLAACAAHAQLDDRLRAISDKKPIASARVEKCEIRILESVKQDELLEFGTQGAKTLKAGKDKVYLAIVAAYKCDWEGKSDDMSRQLQKVEALFNLYDEGSKKIEILSISPRRLGLRDWTSMELLYGPLSTNVKLKFSLGNAMIDLPPSARYIRARPETPKKLPPGPKGESESDKRTRELLFDLSNKKS